MTNYYIMTPCLHLISEKKLILCDHINVQFRGALIMSFLVNFPTGFPQQAHKPMFFHSCLCSVHQYSHKVQRRANCSSFQALALFAKLAALFCKLAG